MQISGGKLTGLNLPCQSIGPPLNYADEYQLGGGD